MDLNGLVVPITIRETKQPTAALDPYRTFGGRSHQ